MVGGHNAGSVPHMQNLNLLHQSFKNPNWSPNCICADNVLNYFCDPGNVFYDVSSCNQHVRMQNLNRPLFECLQNMQGIQFTLVGANHPLYVIMKQRRNSPNNVTPLCYYYVINGTVYQCPDLYTFLQSKLSGAIDPLRQALDNARQCNRSSITRGYYWEFKNPRVENKAEEDEKKPEMERSTPFQFERTQQIIREIIEKFPLPDGVEFEYGKEGSPSIETEFDTQDPNYRNNKETGSDKVVPAPRAAQKNLLANLGSESLQSSRNQR